MSICLCSLINEGVEIEYCPLHDAAEDMLAALKEVRDCLNDPRPTNYSKIHRANQIIEAAILKAEPQ